ncbi:MAG: SusC/RagA family TonB-linked outer membrane protein, partial [Bacteroidota bacterium]
SFDPFEGRSQVKKSLRASWIIEPQLGFNRRFASHTINALIGFSVQEANNQGQSFDGTGYSSDALLGTLGGAAEIRSAETNVDYRYGAGFMRLGYNYKDKYIINITGRSDGSSRFGPGKQYGTFGAVGLAWIFSEEQWVHNLGIISLGKLRVSNGVTGNDQIGDSRFIKTYRPAFAGTYHGMVGLAPSALYNPDFSWETTKKLEAAMELGFFNDRLSLIVASFRNRSSNQLIEYQLPSMTGFSSVFTNFDATVENTGWEYSLSTRNFETKKFRWTTAFNISFLKNKLVEFKGIEESPYATTFKVGEPLSLIQGYIWQGVDPQTGLHTFKDLDNSGSITSADQEFLKPLTTRYFGGISNTLVLAGFELNFFIQFSERNARVSYFGAPGAGRVNQLKSVLQRWQKPGDITTVQRFSTRGTALTEYSRFRSSDGVIEKVSFARLKTFTLSYLVPTSFANRVGLKNTKLFVQGQNLFTKTGFDGWDPETLYGVPPLRIISAGIQLKF